MSATTQTLFERAVKHHLPTVFVSQLDKVDEFELGQVLLYHHKKWWQVFQKKELDHTGLLLESLLVEGDLKSHYKVETEKTELFSATSDSSKRDIDIDLDLDAEVRFAFINLGGKVDGKGSKKVTLTVSLGAVNHIRSNAFQALYGKGYTADLNHPVVKDALARGSALFVISSIYISDKAEIKISEGESVQAGTKDGENTTGQSTAATTTGPATTGAGATTGPATTGGVAGVVQEAIGEAENIVNKDVQEKGDAQAGGDVSITGITVTNRDAPTVIGFNVLKIDLTKTGVLMPTDKSGFTSHHKVHFPYADTFFPATGAPPKEEGGATSKGKEGGATPKGKEGGKGEDGATPKEEGGATSKEESESKEKDKAKDKDGATP